jgi:hypothetical protein
MIKNESICCLKLGNQSGIHRNRIGPDAICDIKIILKKHKLLGYLDLQGLGIGNKGCESIANGIKGNRLINCLNISNNEITQESKNSLMEIVSSCRLKKLNISSNPLQSETLVYISKNFDRSKNVVCPVQELNMSSIRLSTKPNGDMTAFLKYFSSLTKLAIDYNSFYDIPTFEEFILLLGNFNALELLSINYCSITDGMLNYLSKGMPTIKGLKYLFLAGNRISNPDTLRTFMVALSNSEIKNLDLSNNKIDDNGGLAIAKMVGKTKLENLNLSKNYLEIETIKEISSNAMRSNLCSINIKWNLVCDEAKSRITPILNRNMQRIATASKQRLRYQLNRTLDKSEISRIKDITIEKKKRYEELSAVVSISQRDCSECRERILESNGKLQTEKDDETNKFNSLVAQEQALDRSIETLSHDYTTLAKTLRENTSTCIDTSGKLSEKIERIHIQIKRKDEEVRSKLGEIRVTLNEFKTDWY